ncbi:hypothetical protein MNV49_005520 [Pseudohyphozyma bogoriensis]|nr:hypothetical protein MNV49_005520 [Pseudohyphozyma bogoriensis]
MPATRTAHNSRASPLKSDASEQAKAFLLTLQVFLGCPNLRSLEKAMKAAGFIPTRTGTQTTYKRRKTTRITCERAILFMESRSLLKVLRGIAIAWITSEEEDTPAAEARSSELGTEGVVGVEESLNMLMSNLTLSATMSPNSPLTELMGQLKI